MAPPVSGKEDSLSKLSIEAASSKHAIKSKANPKKKEAVADSWEDEDVSDSEPSIQDDEPLRNIPNAPPPTPISPTLHTDPRHPSWSATGDAMAPSNMQFQDGYGPAKRPEKTDAVARRMIAGALGIKAPKMTDEQKAYERAMKDMEKTRREKEREEEKRRKEETERAKAAIWED